MLRTEIIQQLNESNSEEAFAFPYFSASHPVDARLSVYRSVNKWAIFIETFIVDNHGAEAHEACHTMFFCYGNDLIQSPGIADPMLWVTGDGPSGPLFESPVDNLISPKATDMSIRGKAVPITMDPAHYAAAGIELRLLSSNSPLWAQYIAAGIDLGQPPRIFSYELLRLIAPKHRRLFFATESEIIERIGEPMPLLLRLDEWRHPDRDEGEAPADSESFQMIADVIAHNDPSLYQPTVPPNTHWRNWPMAGMI